MRRSVKREVRDVEQRRVGNARLADVLFPALTAIKHHHQMDDVEARIAQRLDRAKRITSRRDHVLDDCHTLTRCEPTLELLAGAVALRLLAHQQQRKTGLHRHHAAQKHRPKLWRGQSLCFFGDKGSEVRADSLQELRVGLEKKLVEVAVGPLARTKDEIAPQIRRRDKVAPQRLPVRNHRLNLIEFLSSPFTGRWPEGPEGLLPCVFSPEGRSTPPGARPRKTRAAESPRRSAPSRAGSACETGIRSEG